MIYTIAIVEDELAEAEILRSYFQRYTAENGDTFEIKHFSDGVSFLSAYQPIYDLVLMDIDLPKINGMEAAAQLRRLDQAVALIFVTSLARYAVKGYEVDAMDFLVKPVSYTNFSIKLQRAVSRARSACGSELLINIPEGVYRINFARIKYVEVINHSLVYHTTEGNFTCTGKLKDTQKLLDGNQFILCNRCYLVNLAFVRAVRGNLLVVDQDELQISRPKRAAVLDALNNYLGGGA